MGEAYIEKLNKRIDYVLNKFLSAKGSKDGEKYCNHYERLMKHHSFVTDDRLLKYPELYKPFYKL